MSELNEFLNLVNICRQSNLELKKFNHFIKRSFKTQVYDLSAFARYNFDAENVEREMTSLLKEDDKHLQAIQICSYHISKNRICIKLQRPSVIRSIFTEVSERQSNYGKRNDLNNKVYRISCSDCKGLTRLRMSKAAQVVAALIVWGGGMVTDSEQVEGDIVETICLSHAANSGHKVLVSRVTMPQDRDLSEEDLTQLRTDDMLAMSDHKGLDEKSLRQLVDAAITFDLLSVKLEKPVCLELSSQPKSARQSNSKGAPFVLYNYARLNAILDKYDYGVNRGVYPPLSSVNDINYSLLSLEDEWSLLYDLVSKWPAVTAECQDLQQPPLHHLTGYLSALSSTFSVYYRHTRVLNDGLPHMLPLMEARIHLLLTIKQVFLIAFSLLGINPLAEM